jgi:uncharacterized membrane protein
MTTIEWFFALKLIHIGSLIFWLGPSLGGWLMLLANRKKLGEHSPATHLAYTIFIRLLIIEHIAFFVLLGTGIAMASLVYTLQTPWLQWKLLIIFTLILPLEIADIWYGNIKLPQIFSRLNEAGYDAKQTRTLHIYHAYLTHIAIVIIPVSVLAIMWLVIAKPHAINLW